MTGAYDWRGDIGEVWAEEWRRTDRSLAPVNHALIAEAAAILAGREGPRILDLGCGAGATSLALADALPGADITGLDLSPALVAAARARAGSRPRLRFEAGDAASWSPDEAGFDLIVSRHGIMFFDDPVGAFAHIRSLARPGGGLLFSCFRSREENEWVRAMRPVVARFAPETLAAAEQPVGPFAFADPARIETILGEAGFAPPRIAPLDFTFAIGVGDAPVDDALLFFKRIGPIAAMLKPLAEADRAAAAAMLAEIIAAHESGGHVAFGAAAWIVASVRP